ncbi:MAG: histidine phosphatase family protein [Acidobacteriota bacterium]
MLWLIRHGETEWSLSGAHTGLTDIPLTKAGEEKAVGLREKLAGQHFALVLTSPLQRARRTCELAGLGAQAQVEPNLVEWNYGEYEGRTTAEIRKERPGWYLFRDGVPGGETVEQVGARAQAVIGRALTANGDVALFGHGHILRILAACWLNLAPAEGKALLLGTAGIGNLGFEHGTRVIERWNC